MSRFDYFILLAEMRTGSNLLEANINMLDGVTCHGEAFNPSFVGYPKIDAVLGVDRDSREKDPLSLLAKIRDSDTMGGFRFFHDHDPRVLNSCIDDPRCAKIILTRNPLDSFVSWKTAQATGQWKLTNATHSKSISITFDPAAFEAHLEAIQAFQLRIQHALQISGQTAFYINYDDLRDVDVLNGLAMFLGVDSRLGNVNKKLKKQNPEPLKERVTNYDEMKEALVRLDRFDLGRTPHFEPPMLRRPRQGSCTCRCALDLIGLCAVGWPNWMAQNRSRNFPRNHCANGRKRGNRTAALRFCGIHWPGPMRPFVTEFCWMGRAACLKSALI